MASAVPAGGPEEVRQAARGILSGAEFQPPERHWWDPFLQFLNDPIGTLDGLYGRIIQYWPSGWQGIVLALVVVTIALVVTLVAVVRLTRSVAADESAPISFAPTFGSKTPDELLAEALQMETEMRWRDAIRLRYSALLTQLALNEVIVGRVGRTTGEYMREVAENLPSAIVPFSKATELFEWVWYGDGEAGADDARRFADLASTALSEVKA